MDGFYMQSTSFDAKEKKKSYEEIIEWIKSSMD